MRKKLNTQWLKCEIIQFLLYGKEKELNGEIWQMHGIVLYQSKQRNIYQEQNSSISPPSSQFLFFTPYFLYLTKQNCLYPTVLPGPAPPPTPRHHILLPYWLWSLKLSQKTTKIGNTGRGKKEFVKWKGKKGIREICWFTVTTTDIPVQRN